jgi:hypothetical protein
MPGADANVPKLSFSAALTKPIERPGTIKFDTIFVNEGDFYDPSTGKASTTQAILTRNLLTVHHHQPNL